VRAAALALLSARAVRARAHAMLEEARRGALEHFRLHEERLDAVADYVIATIRANYPSLSIPLHSRWRHFMLQGADRAAPIFSPLAGDPAERARTRFELAITSVLLDAGAGAQWRYRDAATGRTLARSEGLAIASLEAFAAGRFSSDPKYPARADAAGLIAVTPAALAAAFQANAGNPLAGLEGRAALLNRLGSAIAKQPEIFGASGRLGGLFDRIAGNFPSGLEAEDVLGLVLRAFGHIWPGRIALGGVDLGDTWRHPAIRTNDATTGLMPLHKLSQWLTYSLFEPLAETGIPLRPGEGLTGLAEYRNGGLFLDLGALALKDDRQSARSHTPGETLVVEWRALTVALLDELALRVRRKLGRSEAELPLGSILEGGTWAAGRRIAAELRPGGTPPLNIASDGSVF
jgi:Protein of unknown function (DUF1688)